MDVVVPTVPLDVVAAERARAAQAQADRDALAEKRKSAAEKRKLATEKRNEKALLKAQLAEV